MLLCLTANHRNASFDLLEKLSIGAPSAAHTLVGRSDGVHGAVVLATCNRFEAYLDVESPVIAEHAALDASVRALSEASGLAPDALRDSVTVLRGADVVEHLFAVSSGLESVVVGENEISGQVRRALEDARTAGTTSPALEQLFQRASTTSRTVKTTTAVGTAGRSLVRLALELASSRIPDWSQAGVLMIGTGSYAGASLAALRDRGVEDVVVFSPSGRALKFAMSHGIRATTDLVSALDAADVIVTCTTVESHVITPESFGNVQHKLVIDLGLPRNVDPAVAGAEGIELLDLETISLHAPLEELNATDDARTVVGNAAAAFSVAEAEHAITPAVVALRRHIFGLLDAEIARARGRVDSTPQTEAALRHLASVLLHAPSVRARELARDGNGQAFADGVAAVFGITADKSATDAATSVALGEATAS